MGHVYQIQNNYRLAVWSYSAARGTYGQFRVRLSVAKVDLALAEMYRSEGKYNEAMLSYLQAKEFFDSSDDLLGRADATRTLEAISSGQNDPLNADQSYTQAGNVYTLPENQQNMAICAQVVEAIDRDKIISSARVAAPSHSIIVRVN